MQGNRHGGDDAPSRTVMADVAVGERGVQIMATSREWMASCWIGVFWILEKRERGNGT